MPAATTADRLASARGIPEVFDAVKEAVRRVLGKERAGLMVVTQEIGNIPDGFLGAYFVVGANAIVVNQTPLRRIKETEPALYIPWLFGVLLHEYLHSLGILDEAQVRKATARYHNVDAASAGSSRSRAGTSTASTWRSSSNAKGRAASTSARTSSAGGGGSGGSASRLPR